MYSLICSVKLNGFNPEASLRQVLSVIADDRVNQIAVHIGGLLHVMPCA